MAFVKTVPVSANVITRRAAPGFYEYRVGQTLFSSTPVQWQYVDGTAIGSPSKYLLLTSAMAQKVVRAGPSGTKYLALPVVDELAKTTDLTPSENRTITFNRDRFSDFDQGRPVIDWMKSARIISSYSTTLGTTLNGVSTTVVVSGSIPSDLPQTGTLRLTPTQEIAYTSWTGSTFTIPSTDFTSNIKTAGSTVSVPQVTALQMQSSGVLDANFWPTKTPNYSTNMQFVWADVGNEWEGEYFNVTWDGAGAITTSLQFTTASSGANSLRIRANTSIPSPSGTHQLRVEGAVTNVKIIPERYATEHANGDTFRPELVAFHSASRLIRMMDWGATNNSLVANWADRPLTSHATWNTGRGVPLETQLDLTIEAGCSEIWFCVPHLATNAYVTSFGQWLEANIPTGLIVNGEYTNEAWNSVFDQTDYLDDVALADWGISFGRSQAYGRRAAEVMYLIAQEFTGNLVRVCGTQAANTSVTTARLTAPEWLSQDAYFSASLGITMAAPHTYFDALAVANYIYAQLDNAGVITAMRAAYAISNDAGHQYLFNKFMEPTTGLIEIDVSMRAQKAVADTYGLRMIGYEGGNHAVYGGAPPSDANLAQNLGYIYSFFRSDYYAEVFYHLWFMWEDISDGPFMQFSDVGDFGVSGVWTLREDFNHAAHPVEQVARYLARNRSPWWTQ